MQERGNITTYDDGVLVLCCVINSASPSVPAGNSDNASVSLVTYKGDYYACTESNFMYRVDPETLETIKKVQIIMQRQKFNCTNSVSDSSWLY